MGVQYLWEDERQGGKVGWGTDKGKHLACLLRLGYRVISSIEFFLTKPCLLLIVGILDPNYLRLEHFNELMFPAMNI